MAAGDLITQDFQLEYNNVLVGEGTGIELVSFDLFSAPESRMKNLNRPIDHGSFSTSAFYGGRNLSVDLEVWGATEDELQTNLISAMKFTQLLPLDEPLVAQLPGFGKVRLEGKCTRRAVSPIDQDYNVGYKATVNADFWCPNPRILSNTEGSLNVTKSAAAGGLTYDITYDIAYGTLGSGAFNITNTGSFETRPFVTVYGPISGFALENVTTGHLLSFNGTLGSSDFLTIDFLTRQVLLNGTASRYLWVVDVTQWWSLEPGVNQVRLNGSTAGSPYATFTWRSAWM